MRIVVVSDTHAPRRWKACPLVLARAAERADLILHAGDVCIPGVLDELGAFAPVVAVAGNNDGPDITAWGAAPTWTGELGDLTVAMIHDAGPAIGRAGRMHRRFPSAGIVVFGHSHIPLDGSSGPVRIFNPGSPTDRRRQPAGTFGILDVDDGKLHARLITTE